MRGCRRSWKDKLKCVKILSVKGHNSAKIFRTWIISPHGNSRLVVQHPCQFSFKSMQRYRRSWEDKLNCVKILSVKNITLPKFVEHELSPHMHFMTCVPTSLPSVIQIYARCRSWEAKLKCVKILSVKDHNSAKFVEHDISPHALLGLWCNIPAKFHSNPCNDVGVEKTS